MLAINTAFMTANLALSAANGKVVLREVDAKSKHSENVLKTIDEMCEEAGVTVVHQTQVAVVIGPGSFTGLRIGVAIAKALACVNKELKLIALSSLELMAYIIAKQQLCKGRFVCVLNGLSGLAFVAEFDQDGRKMKEEQMIACEELEKFKCPKFGLEGDNMQKFTQTQLTISSQDLLEFALLKSQEGKFVDEKDLLPLYLRLSQAEDALNSKKV